MLNPFNTLHGGCYALLADTLTTITLLATYPNYITSVSANLAINYLASTQLNDTLLIICRVLKAGHSVAWIEFRIERRGQLVCHGIHTKHAQIAKL